MNEIFPKVHRSILKYKDKALKSIVKDLVILSVILLVVACEKVPKYGKTPEISFNGIDIVRNVQNSLSTGIQDNVTIKLNYKDGDGDLGLTTDELGSSESNYIIDVQRQRNGVFTTLVLDLRLDGKFPKLSTDNVVGPIDGILSNLVFIPQSFPFVSNDTIRFDIKILDRAKNVSNTITTPAIIIYQ